MHTVLLEYKDAFSGEVVKSVAGGIAKKEILILGCLSLGVRINDRFWDSS